MKTITSKDNKNFKMCLQLESRKHRDKLGKYLIEGPNLIREALNAHVIPEILVLSEEATLNPEICGLCEEYTKITDESREEKILVFNEDIFKKLAQTEHSQGILGVVKKNVFKEEEFFEAAKRGSGNILVLDRLQDPGNVGTIIRTADAADYGGVMILRGTVDIFSPKVVRACTGSLFRVPLIFTESAQQGIKLLVAHGKKVVSTGFETDKYYYDVDLKSNIALVIGNEGNGICDEFKTHSHEVVKIPMAGNIESLNASVAAAILMYETMRNR